MVNVGEGEILYFIKQTLAQVASKTLAGESGVFRS